MSEPSVELDCRGIPCPRPVIELAKALPTVEVGELLAVVSDDPAARHDVPAWCRMRGQEYVGEDSTADGLPRYVVKRLT
ncbi:preprotein translocase subunit TatB [Nocardioides humilatus]|uniref:Preprotein translocase subunit TatB n=1 Tax=Nocardioides humilatus TaxID=2607660 RepID=A0A5B1LB80_9ACTN|nr:sulfurtransferase TusA family protein [Nocardioides humilatus]KAA1417993.1 preprotein translocase subunit TatB [Nocardioides humilatus]